MQVYLLRPHGETVRIPTLPLTREEVTTLILRYSPQSGAVGAYRIVTDEHVNLSFDESCDVPAFAVEFQLYANGEWGLMEASAMAHRMSGEFAMTIRDVMLLLEHELKLASDIRSI
ncbi:hypothetical protein AB4Z32_17110 [Massilia sp. 2TAF26]|uniref:hypothetical protein n=1 Tax=Massilia sp. 2TAF26 TaxID=3233012 RepID=UPI003F952769